MKVLAKCQSDTSAQSKGRGTATLITPNKQSDDELKIYVSHLQVSAWVSDINFR